MAPFLVLGRNMEVQTSPSIKIRFPNSVTQNHWAIEEQIQKTAYAVPFLAALMAVASAKPIEKSALFEFLSAKVSTRSDILEKTLSSLLDKKIILPTTGSETICNNIQNWKKSGWADAADYHFFTWDAPFLDYSKEGGGHEIDRKKMVHFQSLQPDIKRFKKYGGDLFEIPLPSLDISYSEIKRQPLSTKIQFLLSCVFGKKGEKACHWSDVPLIRRTSPSGGSRHPSEGYFLTGGIQGIEKGFYHVQTDPPILRRISDDASELENFESQRTAMGMIVLTTIFERNMYRYREPRTFRTVHIDVGHLLTSIEALSHELGMKTTIQLHMNEERILKRIGASKLEEGAMAQVILHEAAA